MLISTLVVYGLVIIVGVRSVPISELIESESVPPPADVARDIEVIIFLCKVCMYTN